MSTQLGRLTPVPLRDVWPHEAHHFTTWLLANADTLSDVLDMDLELKTAEHKVGDFSLDLIGTDLSTNSTVIVENQLETSDHSHLGQLLTYAGGTDPRTIVWCAPSFREEHRAAIDWLNEHTTESTRFFAVEITVVRIGDSVPAPLFRLAAKPNDWTKRVHTQTAKVLGGKAAMYVEFWTELLRRIRDEHPDWSRSLSPDGSSWITLPFGSSIATYIMSFTRNGPALELSFGSTDAGANSAWFARFLAYRPQIDGDFGRPLDWDELDGKKSCRVRYQRPEGGDVTDLEQREALIEWFITEFSRFRAATQQARNTVAKEQA